MTDDRRQMIDDRRGQKALGHSAWRIEHNDPNDLNELNDPNH